MRRTNSFIWLFFVLLLALGTLGHCRGDLRKNFYRDSCPEAEEIVRNMALRHVSSNPVLPARLLRMHFHDCFVRGCDASILLNSTGNSTAEKDSVVNQFITGFDVIEDIKARLEKTCPRVVSCADIVALATRDAVSAQFNRPLWEVLTGRRDGTVSVASEVLTNIPAPTFNFSSLKQNFASKGLTVHDLVVLSGGHTIGVGHCSVITNRLFNFTGKGDPDPSLNATYAAFLRTKCPNNPADVTTTVEMDPGSSRLVDNNYFVILKQNKGLFTSDAALLTNKGSSNIVSEMLKSNKFFTEFSQSMKRMAAIGVLTRNQGEIRKICGAINS